MKRIQRFRAKGWRMPPGTVYVGRPSKWGNPFKVDEIGLKIALRSYEIWLDEQCDNNPHFLDELWGKDLACFCPLNKPCHADILIKKVMEDEDGTR